MKSECADAQKFAIYTKYAALYKHTFMCCDP